MVKAIIFDADGVIVRPKIWFFVPAEKKYGIPKKFSRKWGVSLSAAEFIQAWVKHEHHLDTVLLGQIQQLRQNGIPCYLGTNQERHGCLDGVFVSSDLGARKPEPAF